MKMASLEKPTIILVGGALAAALVFGIGKANTYRLEANLRNLQTECIEEGKKETLAKSFGGILICDPMDLYLSESSKNPHVGIQAKVVAAQKDVFGSEKWFLPVAIVLLVMSALPWFWYFLLRRIRELRDAILGK